MISLKKILLPTDGSDFSRTAVKYGLALAVHHDSEVTLLHIVENISVDLIGPGYYPDEVYNEIVTNSVGHAEKMLSQYCSNINLHGLNVKQVVVKGDVFSEIVRYGKEDESDLIVIGTHGRTGLSHLLMGSVCEKVVRNSPCPVLSVKPDGHQFVPL